MPVQINISGENAAQALQELKDLASGALADKVASGAAIAAAEVAVAAVTAPTYTTQPAPPTVPAYAPPPVPPQASPAVVPTAATPAPAVPVAAPPTYTLEQLGVAAGPLVDAGRGPELMDWLNQRGASALTNLDKSLYGDFAIYLRSLGARI